MKEVTEREREAILQAMQAAHDAVSALLPDASLERVITLVTAMAADVVALRMNSLRCLDTQALVNERLEDRDTEYRVHWIHSCMPKSEVVLTEADLGIQQTL
jgi:hypothetical protein